MASSQLVQNDNLLKYQSFGNAMIHLSNSDEVVADVDSLPPFGGLHHPALVSPAPACQAQRGRCLPEWVVLSSFF